MLNIDGSQGEGGGQIVRSSLAMSLVTGTPVTIYNIRARRKNPGLMRQHLTAAQAAAQVSAATLAGAAIGSRQLTFRPDRIATGEYLFRVGTAGSATLVLQTVLPALLIGDGRSQLTLEGGTHNPWAPPFDFLDKAYLPLVRRMGPRVEAKLERPGFYPAGGGRFTVSVEPAPRLAGFDVLERGPQIERRVRAIVASLPRHIAQREVDEIRRRTDWPDECFRVEQIRDARGPGNVVIAELRCEHVTEVFTGFGRRGVRAEQVAHGVAEAVLGYLQAGVPVGPCLADQLMLPLGISAHFGGGGTYRTVALTEHSRTHLDVLKQFLDVDTRVDQNDENDWSVRISAART